MSNFEGRPVIHPQNPIPLKAMLRDRGIAQHILATAVGVSQATLCHWLNGHTKPSGWHVTRLKEVLAELGLDGIVRKARKRVEG